MPPQAVYKSLKQAVLKVSCLHVSLRMSENAFHWNSLRQCIHQSVNFINEARHNVYSYFAFFLILKWHIMWKIC